MQEDTFAGSFELGLVQIVLQMHILKTETLMPQINHQPAYNYSNNSIFNSEAAFLQYQILFYYFSLRQ